MAIAVVEGVGRTPGKDIIRIFAPLPGTTSLTVPDDETLPDGTYTASVVASTPSGDRSSATVTFTIRNCPADLDRSGSVTVEDLYAYLNAWLAGRDPVTNEPRAMTMDDVMVYVNQWFAGCAPTTR